MVHYTEITNTPTISKSVRMMLNLFLSPINDLRGGTHLRIAKTKIFLEDQYGKLLGSYSRTISKI